MVRFAKDNIAILRHNIIGHSESDIRPHNSLFPGISKRAYARPKTAAGEKKHGAVVIPVIDRATTTERDARFLIRSSAGAGAFGY
jgi:hypothetical protein